jgi:hypothetical protein
MYCDASSSLRQLLAHETLLFNQNKNAQNKLKKQTFI